MRYTDNEDPEEPIESKYSKFFTIYTIVLIIIVIATGVFTILAPEFFKDFSNTERILFGMLIVSYGLYRLYKLYKKNKKA